MENDEYYHSFDSDTLFWGALIFLALFLLFFFAWKAIEWLRNRKEFDGASVEESKDPWDQAISRPAADYYSGVGSFGSEGGLGGMNRREQDELLLFSGTWKQRRAIQERRRKATLAGLTQRQREEFLLIHGSVGERRAIEDRRKAREQAQKTQSDS